MSLFSIFLFINIKAMADLLKPKFKSLNIHSHKDNLFSSMPNNSLVLACYVNHQINFTNIWFQLLGTDNIRNEVKKLYHTTIKYLKIYLILPLIIKKQKTYNVIIWLNSLEIVQHLNKLDSSSFYIVIIYIKIEQLLYLLARYSIVLSNDACWCSNY